MAEKGKFKYFSSVQGNAVPRYGFTGFIGCAYRNGNLVWDTDKVVAIPINEFNACRVAYTRELKAKALKERTVEDYDKWLKTKDDRNKKAEALAKKKKSEQESKAPAGEPDENKPGGGNKKKPGSNKKK